MEGEEIRQVNCDADRRRASLESSCASGDLPIAASPIFLSASGIGRRQSSTCTASGRPAPPLRGHRRPNVPPRRLGGGPNSAFHSLALVADSAIHHGHADCQLTTAATRLSALDAIGLAMVLYSFYIFDRHSRTPVAPLAAPPLTT
jgi:hypothetical protein